MGRKDMFAKGCVVFERRVCAVVASSLLLGQSTPRRFDLGPRADVRLCSLSTVKRVRKGTDMFMPLHLGYRIR